MKVLFQLMVSEKGPVPYPVASYMWTEHHGCVSTWQRKAVQFTTARYTVIPRASLPLPRVAHLLPLL